MCQVVAERQCGRKRRFSAHNGIYRAGGAARDSHIEADAGVPLDDQDRTESRLVPRLPNRFRFTFHDFKPVVIVRELSEVRKGDLHR